MTWTPDKIPKWLRRTPEQQARDDAYQEQLKQALGPGRRPNRMEAHLLRAQAMRTAAEAALVHLDTLPEAQPRHVEEAKAKLADALAMQGEFRQAAALHPSTEEGARYLAIAKAIEMDDDAPDCDCPVELHKIEGENRTLAIPSEIISEMVFSRKHGKMMPLIRCVKCEHLNVKPAPKALSERAAKIHEAHQKAKRERQ